MIENLLFLTSVVMIPLNAATCLLHVRLFKERRVPVDLIIAVICAVITIIYIGSVFGYEQYREFMLARRFAFSFLVLAMVVKGFYEWRNLHTESRKL